MNPTRLVLVDDHKLIRAGMRTLIATLDGFEVIGEADDGAAALELVRRDEPDIVITDLRMNGVGGLELSRQLQKEFPQVRVLILSMHADEGHVQQVLRSGVRGYLLKDAAMEELALALDAVMRGEIWLSPAISTQVLQGYIQNNNAAPDPLTPRQLEILKLIAEGEAIKEIAFKLDISIKTVEAHRAQIMERLQIRDTPGLVKYALRSGLVHLE
jgi:DNA-binding NarL/FixJ family response regulator